ncbi:DUF6274 family protein [Streptomyces sp. NPDC101490]|uniref:DUF6274 family protein n=1 Tax=Streptomyces sp. NPDC101490 TaxID=3366143 RepID=UPI003815F66B
MAAASMARHDTRALLRAHLAAAARFGHLTRHCAVCHRLLRLAMEGGEGPEAVGYGRQAPGPPNPSAPSVRAAPPEPHGSAGTGEGSGDGGDGGTAWNGGDGGREVLGASGGRAREVLGGSGEYGGPEVPGGPGGSRGAEAPGASGAPGDCGDPRDPGGPGDPGDESPIGR